MLSALGDREQAQLDRLLRKLLAHLTHRPPAASRDD